MKKFLIILIVVSLLAVGILGLAFFNANKLIAQFKPELEKTLSSLVGTQIQLQGITATVLPQTALKVSGLSIKNTATSTAAESGPEFSEFLLNLNLRELISGQLDITKISIVAPKLTLIKDSTGLRIKGFPIPKKNQSPNKDVPAAFAPSEDRNKQSDSNQSKSNLPIPINLQAIEMKGGTITFEDQVANKSYQLSDLNVDSAVNILNNNIAVSNLGITAKVLDKHKVALSIPKIGLKDKDLSVDSFTALIDDLALQGSANINIKSIKGRARVRSKQVNLVDVVATLSDFIPNISQFDLKGTVIPDIKFEILGPKIFSINGTLGLAEIAAKQGVHMLSNLNGNFSIKADGPSDAIITTQDLKLSLNDQPISTNFSAKLFGTNFTLEDLVLNLLGGSVKGKIDLSLDTQKAFTTKIEGAGINIEKALSMLKAPDAQISGNIDSFSTSVTGNLGENLKSSLRGGLNAKLSNGELKGFNLAGIVLKTVNNLPFLTGALYSSVPASEIATIDSSNTAFRSLDTSLGFEGTSLRVNSLSILAPIFTLESSGKIGFDKNLDLASTIYFNKNFSDQLVRSVIQLKKVLDESGQLVIPLKIQGVPPLLLVYPNLSKLLEVAGKQAIADNAKEIVKGVLEKKGLGEIGSLFGF